MPLLLQVLLLCGFFFSTLLCAIEFTEQEREWIKEHKKVKLGADYSWPPLDFVDEQGKHTGLSSDYLALISQKTGLEFEVETGVWSEVLANMQSKKYDGLSCAVKTKQREEYLLFSTPYLSVPMVILVQNDNQEIDSLEDLFGKKVAINKGSYIHEWLQTQYPQIKLHLTRSNEEAIEALSYGKVDAYVGNLAVSHYIMNKYLINNLKIASKLDAFSTSVSVAIDKQNPLLFGIIQKAIQSITKQEEQQIKNRWKEVLPISEERLIFSLQQQEWISKHKEIRFVIDNDWEPIEYLSNQNIYSGIASSYVDLLAKKTGIRFVRIPTKNWSQSIEKLKTREADMLSCVAKTPSREEVVSFSKPYITMPEVFITKESSEFLTDVRQLYGKKVVFVKGYALAEKIQAQHPKLDVLYVDTLGEAFEAVVCGDAYASIELLPIASSYIQKKGFTTLKISGITEKKLDFSFALRKDWDAIGLDVINLALASISEEEKNEIYEKWVQVQYKKEIDYTLLWQLGAFFGVVLLASFFWNRKLSREIAKRKKAEEKLSELNKRLIETTEQAQSASRAKSDFLSNMSHEIRTPMNAILGFAELLDEKLEDKKLKSFVRTIRSSGQSLLTLINDILDLSKIESGKLEIILKKTNIKKLIDETLSLFVLQAQQKGIHLDVEIDPSLPKALLCDGVRIKEVLINLVGNALKFTEEGSIRVYVKAFKIDKHLSKVDLEIRVKDSGIGISKEAQERIFETFEQQKNQDIAKYGGTGLGLSISKKLAILMDGSLDVESEVGEGATFILKIKHLDIASMDEAYEQGEIDAGSIEFDAAVILVADDVAYNRELIKESFAQTNIELIEAINGEDAIAKVKERNIDLILMDIRMPVMDGYSATRIIKEDFDIPVIALTASIMQEEIDKIKSQRFDAYLRKPVSREELYTEISKFLKHTKKFVQLHQDQEIKISSKQDLRAFLDALTSDIQKSYTQALKSNDLGDITKFAGTLLECAQEFGIEFMMLYAHDLLERIESFEIDSIETLMRQYPKNIELLKQKL